MIWKFTIIKSTGIEKEVEEPVLWDSMTKTIKRDDNWHGIFFAFSEGDLQFIEEAYWIIKEEYLLNGIEGKLYLRVEWSISEGWNPFYNGKFDFGRYKEVCGDTCYITIGVEDNDASTLLANRFDTSVDLTSNKAYDGSTTLTNYAGLNKVIQIPGKAVLIKSNALNDAQIVSENLRGDLEWVPTETGSTQYIRAQILPAFTKTVTTDLANTTFYNSINILRGGFNNMPVGIFPVVDFQEFATLQCVTSAASIKFRYKGKAQWASTGSIGVILTLKLFKLPKGADENTPASYQQIFTQSLVSTSGAGPSLFDVSQTLSVTLNVGDKLFYFVFANIGNPLNFSSFVITEDADCFFDISLHSLCDPSPAKTYLIHEAGSRILENITNNQLRFRSDYYGRTDSQPYNYTADGCGGLRTLSNGLQIRQAVLQDGSVPKVFTSFKDFIESLNAIDCIGYGLEGNDVRVEPVEYFYNNTVIFVADGVDEITSTIRTDRIYKSFSFGYDKYETESTNGLDAIHTKREYRLQISQSDNKLEKLSKIIADGYAIEVTRRKFGKTEDWRYDQNIFMLCLKRAGSNLVVDQNNISSPSNIFDPATVINYAISPIRNGLRWFKWLVQGIRDYTQTALRFSSGDGNYVAKGKLTTGCINEASVIAENDIISVNSYGTSYDPAPFIVPERVSFTYPLGLNEFAFIAANKYGLIKYRRSDDDWQYGWIENIKYSPNEGSAEFTLTTKRV
jgi:hypothetical protein